jgi:hypothetical protein
MLNSLVNSTLLRTVTLFFALSLVAMWATPANASLSFEFNTPAFNGSTPTSNSPYLSAVFTTQSTGTVLLTIASSLNVSTEFISDVAFNVAPAIVPSSLTIIQSGGSPTNIGISNTTQNAQSLQGSGNEPFDVNIAFSTSSSGGGADRFNLTDMVQFTITRAGLTENDFNFASIGGYFLGAHVQGNGLSGALSGTLTAVPEPSSIGIFCMFGLSGLLYRRRMLKSKT